MTRTRMMLVSLLAILLAMPASVRSEVDMARAFETSYAAEAAGNIDEAYRIMNEALGSTRSDYAGVMRLAYLRGIAGKYEEAASLYGSAAVLEPGAIEPLQYQQYHFLLAQNWAKLSEAAQAALALDPYNYTSRTRLAYAAYMRAQYATAAEEYNRVQRLYPLDLDVMIMRGWSYALANRKSQALQIFRKALTFAPSNASAKEGLDYANRLR